MKAEQPEHKECLDDRYAAAGQPCPEDCDCFKEPALTTPMEPEQKDGKLVCLCHPQPCKIDHRKQIDEAWTAEECEIHKDPPNTPDQGVPMGASQWKEHGKKYGYWDYFYQIT